jgi:hypothetical protein
MEFDQEEELAAMCLHALAIALYPSTTFAVLHTSSSSSQSAPDRNKGGSQRSREL